MRLVIFGYCLFYFLKFSQSKLWSKGIVHYAINKKDYDPHSQDVIVSALEKIEKEICVKFFNTPLNYSANDHDKILYISNPEKRKTCQSEKYDYGGNVVDMQIGYKCLNEREIAKVVVDMLRASIENTVRPNSNDLLRKFQEQEADPTNPTLLTAAERNFINAHYHLECGNLVEKPMDTRRSNGGTLEITVDNEKYYSSKLWPLGIVMFGVEPQLFGSTEFEQLHRAMTVIELSSCVVFQHVIPDDVLQPENLLWFGRSGEEVPYLGFREGNQTLVLKSMIYGAPSHTAHTLNLLMRILGIPMMSNRYDRDNYVTVNWKYVEKTKEHFLERGPKEAWLKNIDGESAAYDYDSVTHAPANFMCADCSLGAQTVQPIQDHLWQKTLTMGHRSDLSPADIEMLNLLYSKQCQHRFMSNN